MCAETKYGKPKRRYKQRKSKYCSELWDDMPLHKEPKNKRSENEEEIVANYRAMMNKPKRKYKQRKSKYDSELWSSLPLHRDPKRLTEDEEVDRDLNENNVTKQNDDNCNRMSVLEKDNNKLIDNDNQNSVNNQLATDGRQPSSEEPRTNSHQGEGSSNFTLQQQVTFDISNEMNTKINMVEMEQASTTAEKESSDTLFVQKVIEFLLNEQDINSRKNIIGMFKMDGKLNSICLEEISRRCGSLNCLRDTNLRQVVKEHVFLMKLYKYLSKCKVGRSQSDFDKQGARKSVIFQNRGHSSSKLDSVGNGKYDSVRSNNHSMDESRNQTEWVHQTSELNDLHLLANMKSHFISPNDNGTNDERSGNDNEQKVDDQCVDEPFPISTWMDVSQALSPLSLASVVSPDVDDNEVFTDNVILDRQFLESMDVEDSNTNEIFRLAAVISNTI